MFFSFLKRREVFKCLFYGGGRGNDLQFDELLHFQMLTFDRRILFNYKNCIENNTAHMIPIRQMLKMIGSDALLLLNS